MIRLVKIVRLNHIEKPYQVEIDSWNCKWIRGFNGFEPSHFQIIVNQQLNQCIQKHQKALWIILNTNQLYLSQTAYNNGFIMHHCTKQQLYFNKWLYNGNSRIPQFTTHYLGCGSVVVRINQNNSYQVLLVQEKNGTRKNTWGIVNGRAEINQGFIRGALRQLKQETNIDAIFRDIIFLRHAENAPFKMNDIYLACLVEMINPNQQITIQQQQLIDFRWVQLKKISDFFKKNVCMGTQRELLNRMEKKAFQGYDFLSKQNLKDWGNIIFQDKQKTMYMQIFDLFK